MKKLLRLAFWATIVSLSLITLAFCFAARPVAEVIGLPALLSLPLILPCALLYYLDRKGSNLKNSLLAWAVFGAFAFTVLLHLGFNGLMLLDVADKGTFGPAQGYWLLILVVGAVKTSVLGALAGMLGYCVLTLLARTKGS